MVLVVETCLYYDTCTFLLIPATKYKPRPETGIRVSVPCTQKLESSLKPITGWNLFHHAEGEFGADATVLDPPRFSNQVGGCPFNIGYIARVRYFPRSKTRANPTSPSQRLCPTRSVVPSLGSLCVHEHLTSSSKLLRGSWSRSVHRPPWPTDVESRKFHEIPATPYRYKHGKTSYALNLGGDFVSMYDLL